MTYWLCEAVRVDTETVCMLEVYWSGSVAEQEHKKVNSFLIVVEVVPEHCVIRQTTLGVALGGVGEGRELSSITNGEDGGGQEEPVEDAFLRPHLKGEPSSIANSLCGPSLASNC